MMPVGKFGHNRRSVVGYRPPQPQPYERGWERIKDLISAERRDLKTSDPASPRLKPTLAVSVGWIVRP
jgi:hypothetical protein